VFLLISACAPHVVAGRGASGTTTVGVAGDEGSAPTREIHAEEAVGGGPRSIVVTLNLVPLRKHPVGKRIGPLVASVPQWQALVQGVVKDPVREVDWVYLTSPSITDPRQGAVLVHESLTDEQIDHAIELVHQRSASVKPYDVGVPGVRATIGDVGVGPRVLLRPETGIVALVTPDHAQRTARLLHGARVVPPAPDTDALDLWARSPHEGLPQVPPEIVEARVVVKPRADGGVDATADGACADEAAAARAEAQLHALMDRYDNFIVRAMTHGLLNAVHVSHEGRTVKARLDASRDQVETAVRLVSTFFGAYIEEEKDAN
jgi:hypothetical protein